MSFDPNEHPENQESDRNSPTSSQPRENKNPQRDNQSYPWKWLHLTAEEQVLWSGRRSRLPLIPSFILTGIVVVGVISIFVIGGPMTLLPIQDTAITQVNVLEGITLTVSLLSTLILVMFAVLAVLGVVTPYLRWRFTRYVITTQELYFRTGIISESVIQIRLENIQNTRCSRSIVERLFGYGDIAIQTSGTDTTELLIRNVPNPQEINGILTNQRGRVATQHTGLQSIR